MKTIFFLGQAPARPDSKHEIAGTYLYPWLSSIGMTDDEIAKYCHFYALVDAFPGAGKNGHLAPTKEQIAQFRPTLVKTLQSIQPDLIVPVGKLAIGEVLQRTVSLSDVVGKQFSVNPFGCLQDEIVCVPLSHPSGRSAWNYLHKVQVEDALRLLELSASLDE